MGPSLPQIPVNKLDNQIISWKQKPPNELNKTQTPQCFIIHQILEVLTIIIKKWQHPKDTIDVIGRMVAVLPWKQWLINHRIWYRWAGRRTMTRGRKLITWGDFFFFSEVLQKSNVRDIKMHNFVPQLATWWVVIGERVMVGYVGTYFHHSQLITCRVVAQSCAFLCVLSITRVTKY